MPRSGLVIVISGPSGAGKTTVMKLVRKVDPTLRFSVSATTRTPRDGEVNGVDYHFVSAATFEDMRSRDEFLEWAQVHQQYYGTPRSQVRQSTEAGFDVLLDIDVQGCRQVRQNLPQSVCVFLTPPSLEELEGRLRSRHTETEDKIQVRLSRARAELEAVREYDYVVVNLSEQADRAAAQVCSIIEAERARVGRALQEWPQLVPS